MPREAALLGLNTPMDQELLTLEEEEVTTFNDGLGGILPPSQEGAKERVSTSPLLQVGSAASLL